MEHPDLISTLVPDQRWTTRQVAARLGVHVVTIGRWTRQGIRGVKLRTLRIGGRTLIGAPDLVEFLRRTNEPAGGPVPAARPEADPPNPLQPEPGGAGGGDG